MKNHRELTKPTSSPFMPTDLGGSVDFMALSPKLVTVLLNDFTRHERGLPTGSIGISDCGIVATDTKNLVIVGDISDDGYRTTDPARVMLECEEAIIYGRAFDATPLVPKGGIKDAMNSPSDQPYPSVKQVVDRMNAMEFITELSPEVLSRISKIAKTAGAKRIRILRSVEDPNVFGFQCSVENQEPAFGESVSVPLMGIVTGTKTEEAKAHKEKSSEAVVHHLEFAKTGPSLNEVIRFAVEKGSVSTSTVQRKFKVGFQTAAALIATMETKGVVSEADGAKPRKVLITEENIGEFLEPEAAQKEAISFNVEPAVTVDHDLPSIEIFAPSEVLEQTEDTEGPKHKINDILRDFGIDAGVSETFVGPSVTRFEVSLGARQSVSKVAKLGDDIQMRMEAMNVRIEAPIPGKAAIGIELPNSIRRIVRMREMLTNHFYDDARPLLVTLGLTVEGTQVFADLATMPHLLISGATGSGKSVGLTSLIASLVLRNKPNKLRLLLIDPKRVEMMPFNSLPHLLRPVITESSEAIESLEKLGEMMDERYKALEESGVRNIDSYNEKNPENPFSFVVVVIDELADFMLTGDKERAETAIVRLAQKSRAVGIHLVIATQRPDVSVITGTIKANIPGRIAFMVASQIDSRTILDAKGAETLMGRGDMLFQPAGAKPLRIQGCFISEAEVEDLCKAWNPTNKE